MISENVFVKIRQAIRDDDLFRPVPIFSLKPKEKMIIESEVQKYKHPPRKIKK